MIRFTQLSSIGRVFVTCAAGALCVGGALVGCGARTGLPVGSTGVASGGAGNTGGSGGAPVHCNGMELVVQPTALTSPSLRVRSPEMGLLPPDNDVFMTVIESGGTDPGILRVGRLDAFKTWPPAFDAMVELEPDATHVVVGMGQGSPSALVRHVNGQLDLVTSLLPTPVTPIAAPTAMPLFVAGLTDRWLYGTTSGSMPGSGVNLTSYQTGGSPEYVPPGGCDDTTTSPLGAAISLSGGFLTAFGDASAPGGIPCIAKAVRVMRYQSPEAPGTSLVPSMGDLLVADNPIVHLVMTPTSNGAWIVFQEDVSTVVTGPPVFAVRVDSQGHAVPVGSSWIQVSSIGVATGDVAAAAWGDGVAVGWVNQSNPSAPTIQIQWLDDAGQKSFTASVPTDVVPLGGKLRMLASADRRSLLLAWESVAIEARIGLARLDCVQAL